MMMHYEKQQRTTDDIFIFLTYEEESYRKKFTFEQHDNADWKCTVCAKVTSDKPYPHPALRVSICFNCLNLYQNAIFLTNKDGTDKNCRWCTNPAKKYSCSSCTVMFCKDCLERNFDSEFVQKKVANNSDWNCFICYPTPIWRLRVVCSKAMENNSTHIPEVLNSRSQESRPVLPTNETENKQLCDEMSSQNITEIDNNSKLQTEQQTITNNEHKISTTAKNSLSLILEESEKDFQCFIRTLTQQISRLSQKYHNDINTYPEAEKLVNKVSEFCDKIVENVNHIKTQNETRYDVWLASAKFKQNNNIYSELIPNNNNTIQETPKNLQEIPKKYSNTKSLFVKKNIDTPCTSKTTKDKKKLLSLKPSKDPEEQISINETEVTLSFLEQLRLKLPDDKITPKKKSNYPDTLLSPNSNLIIRRSPEEAGPSNCTFPSNKIKEEIEEKHEELMSCSKRPVAKKHTGVKPKLSCGSIGKKKVENGLKVKTQEEKEEDEKEKGEKQEGKKLEKKQGGKKLEGVILDGEKQMAEKQEKKQGGKNQKGVKWEGEKAREKKHEGEKLEGGNKAEKSQEGEIQEGESQQGKIQEGKSQNGLKGKGKKKMGKKLGGKYQEGVIWEGNKQVGKKLEEVNQEREHQEGVKWKGKQQQRMKQEVTNQVGKKRAGNKQGDAKQGGKKQKGALQEKKEQEEKKQEQDIQEKEAQEKEIKEKRAQEQRIQENERQEKEKQQKEIQGKNVQEKENQQKETQENKNQEKQRPESEEKNMSNTKLSLKSSPIIPKKEPSNISEDLSSPNRKTNLQTETSFLDSSPHIKSEINSQADDNSFNFSQATILREIPPCDDLSGKEELMKRILEDFGEETNENFRANDVVVRIEHYIDEKTGQHCQIYKSGPASNDSESSQEDVDLPGGEKNCEKDDSEKTEEYDWDKMINKDDFLAKEEIKSEIMSVDIKLSPVFHLSQEDLFETSLENIKSSTKVLSRISKNLTQNFQEESENINNTKPVSELNSEFSDSEYEREKAVKSLEMKTDSSETESSSSSDSDDSEYQNTKGKKSSNETEYVKQLNIEEEMAKHQENNKPEAESKNEDEKHINEKNKYYFHPKFQPVVVLDRNFKRNLNPIRAKKYIEDSDEEDNEDNKNSEDSKDSQDEINRITNLKRFKKRQIISSDSESEFSNSRQKRLRKKARRTVRPSSSDSDSDRKSEKSEHRSDDFVFSQNDPDFVPVIDDDLLNDSLTDETTSDESENILEPKTRQKRRRHQRDSITSEEEETDESPKENDAVAKWRKNKLLTGSIFYSATDTDVTNDSTANEILKKEEEWYQSEDKEKRNRKKSVESIISSGSDIEEVLISISDDDDDDDDDHDDDHDDDDNNNSASVSDDDIQIIEVKRNQESDDDDEADKTTKNKKGRRNIREVLKDSELQEETQKADKEEAERKERITLKQRTLESLLSESQLSQEEVGYVLDVDEETKEPLITVHHTLVPRLKEHQKKGIKFLWDACYESVAELKQSLGAGCILAHCMGLGKTMQVVVLAHTLLTHKTTNVKHVLIVCPLSTVFNWRNEFQQTLKVCPKPIQIFDIRHGRQKNFKEKILEVKRWNSVGGALILGYESFLSLVNEEKLNKIQVEDKKIVLESLINPGPDLVVCDEGHMLKNGKTLRFTSLSKIKTRRRIILTGTPLQNNLIEYYHMVNFVKPHLLGTLEEYKNRFVNPILNGQYEDSNESDIKLMKKRSHILHKKLENSVQRYEVSELQAYLPPMHDNVLFLQLTPLQIKLYEHYLQLPDVGPSKLFKNYHSLQNIWTHPALLKIKLDKKKNPPQKKQKRYDEDFVQALDPDSEFNEPNWFEDLLPEDVLTNISYGMKIEILFSVIKECEAIKDKLLIFSSSIDELDLIEFFLKQQKLFKGLDYCRMDGAVVPQKRVQYCNDFNNENNQRNRIFLISHKVGGLGLNLTAANRVVLMDVNWNPAYDIQSIFRVYRFGQTKPCYFYRFVSMGTMEEVVYVRAVTKLAISCRVVDEHQIKRHFNSDDLHRMYSLNKDFGEPPIPPWSSDRLLAKLWDKHKPFLFKFCDHQMLLQNQTHEELNEEEMKLALEEFAHELEREKQAKEQAALIKQQNAIYLAQLKAQNNDNTIVQQNNYSVQQNNIYVLSQNAQNNYVLQSQNAQNYVLPPHNYALTAQNVQNYVFPRQNTKNNYVPPAQNVQSNNYLQAQRAQNNNVPQQTGQQNNSTIVSGASLYYRPISTQKQSTQPPPKFNPPNKVLSKQEYLQNQLQNYLKNIGYEYKKPAQKSSSINTTPSTSSGVTNPPPPRNSIFSTNTNYTTASTSGIRNNYITKSTSGHPNSYLAPASSINVNNRFPQSTSGNANNHSKQSSSGKPINYLPQSIPLTHNLPYTASANLANLANANSVNPNFWVNNPKLPPELSRRIQDNLQRNNLSNITSQTSFPLVSYLNPETSKAKETSNNIPTISIPMPKKILPSNVPENKTMRNTNILNQISNPNDKNVTTHQNDRQTMP